VPPGDVTAVVQAALGGAVATTQLEADRQFNVTVRLAPEYRGTIDSVGRIKVAYTTPRGTRSPAPPSTGQSVQSGWSSRRVNRRGHQPVDLWTAGAPAQKGRPAARRPQLHRLNNNNNKAVYQ
jgi:multidrug efflux pump subunit AcrB